MPDNKSTPCPYCGGELTPEDIQRIFPADVIVRASQSILGKRGSKEDKSKAGIKGNEVKWGKQFVSQCVGCPLASLNCVIYMRRKGQVKTCTLKPQKKGAGNESAFYR